KLIAAGARLHENLRAGRAPILRRVSARQDLKLLQRVNRKETVRAAERREAGQSACAGLAEAVSTGSNADVGRDAVHHEVVGAGALAVDGELPLLAEGGAGERDAGRERDDGLEAAPVQGQVLDHLPVERRRHGGRTLDDSTVRANGDGLADGAD